MQAWRRTHRAVWVANLATAAGMMSFLPFFPSHLERLGVEGAGALELWTGVIFGAAPFSAAFMSPIWGALGDRFGRRLMVLRAMGAITVFVGAMAFVTNPWQLLALRLLQGVFSGFVAPSMTLVSIAAPASEQGRVASSLQVAMSFGAILGPLLGELVRDLVGPSAVYLSVAALSAFSALLVLAFASEDASKRRALDAGPLRVGAVLRASLGDLGELRASRGLRAAVVLLFWIQFGNGATLPLLEIYEGQLRAGASWLPVSTAALFSVPAAMNLIAMPLWGRLGDRRGHVTALLVCALASGVLLAAHALVLSYEQLLAARLVFGAAMAGAGPLAFGVAAVEIPEDRRGGAFGVVFSARALAVSSSAMLGGWLAGWLGIRGLYWVGGGAVLFTFWAFARAGRAAGS